MAMLRLQAEKAAMQMMMSEFRHHKYEDEKKTHDLFLYLDRDEFIRLLNSVSPSAFSDPYVDVLAPTRLRAMKNALICYVTPLCRMAIEMGVDSELSFALSDFYINHVETLSDENSIVDLFAQLSLHYYDLVKAVEVRQFSKHVADAIRYIRRNLYSVCRVEAVAEHVGLERHYFSALFGKQVGQPPSRYILLAKLAEARRILRYEDLSLTEIAESLCFYDVAHFSRRFKEIYGQSPLMVLKRDRAGVPL